VNGGPAAVQSSLSVRLSVFRDKNRILDKLYAAKSYFRNCRIQL
jgi:hypothetical protein